VNIASRCAGFVHKFFNGKLAQSLPADESVAYAAAAQKLSACAALYDARDYAAAMRAIVEVADAANAYIAENAPWTMAKDESMRERLHVVCTLAINYFRLLTVWLAPVVPATAVRAFAFLGESTARFDTAAQPRLGASIREFSALATRIDSTKIDAMIEASKENLQPSAAPAAPTPVETPKAVATISIDDFARMDLRVGKVLECGFVDGSDKLLRFLLDAGELGQRQIFSGIRAAYQEPEKLVGRNVVFIANLAPRKMRFGVSEGMILSAGSGGSDLHLLDADTGAKAGMPVK
jgi:methionyl-tRNA synthetase